MFSHCQSGKVFGNAVSKYTIVRMTASHRWDTEIVTSSAHQCCSHRSLVWHKAVELWNTTLINTVSNAKADRPDREGLATVVQASAGVYEMLHHFEPRRLSK